MSRHNFRLMEVGCVKRTDRHMSRCVARTLPVKPGFTLLEVMLALALSALVLIAVSIAVDLHLRVLDTGRTQVEEAQLARAILRQIADDLRSAVLYKPMDVKGLIPESMLPSGDLSDLAGGMDLDPETLAAVEEAEDLDSASTDSVADSTEPPPEPGLYGNQYELQVDTSRLPRIDQFDGMLAAAGDTVVADRVSEVKTVAYYVVEAPVGAAAYVSGETATRGLVRRALDRATTAFAAERGELIDVQQNIEPLAPEVAAVEFRYFDGTEWQDEWDSAERGGLPMAVEVVVAIIPFSRRDQDARPISLQRSTVSGLALEEKCLVYRLLVHLPVAEPTDEEGTTATSEETSEDSGDDTAAEPGGDTGPAPPENPAPGGGPGP